MLFGKKKKNKGQNECFCNHCSHEQASECLEIKCFCCYKADTIRLKHITVAQDDLSPEEIQRRESEKQEEERRLKRANPYGGLWGGVPP